MFAKRTNWNLTPNRLSVALEKHRASGKPLVDLTVSNPTICGFQYDAEAILGTLRDPQALTYTPDPKGLRSARQAVAAYYAERGATVSTDEIILTTSTSEAYTYIFRALCDPGDELLIPAPSYPLFDFLADIQDVKLVPYPLVYDHGWQIDFHSLETAINSRTRGVIVVHPNNPTGHFVKQTEARRLSELCLSRDMAIIGDEVFLDFALRADRPITFATSNTALTFTLSGLSKIAGLPQMKVAWIITSGPQGQKREALPRLEVIADTYLSPNAPVQLAVPALFAQRRTFQEQLITRVRKNLAELDHQLKTQNVCARLEVEGGWYAILRVPATQPDDELAIRLLEEKNVYVHPGHFFDFPGDGYLVVSLIVREQEFREGIRLLLSSIDSDS